VRWEVVIPCAKQNKLRTLTRQNGNGKFCTLLLAAFRSGVKDLANSMNKIVASVGLAALGVASAEAQMVPGQTATMTKPWSAAVTLRGFYDDNLNTVSANKQDVFGFEVSPSVGWQWAPSPQTHFSIGYLYSFKYYDHTPNDQSQRYDQSHAFNLALEHAFSERQQLVLGDSFVIGQEPDFLRAGNSMATFQRISGNNIRNYGSIAFKEQFTRLFGIEVGYNNAYYDYSAHNLQGPGGLVAAGEVSPSGALDRLEHTLHLDTRWVIQPETVGVFGYQFRWADYTGNEEIAFTADPNFPNGTVMSENRNYREHYVYVGADHTFRPDLTASARVGARFIDFYNDPGGNGNGWGPYAMVNVTWVYNPDSRVELGVSHDISSTDITGATDEGTEATTFTSSQETTVVYASINHRITPKLRGSLIGQFQTSEFKGGPANSKSEQDYLLGLNLTYQFTQHLSGELGYNYDKLQSEIGRSFDRNRVYIGVTAGY